MTPDELTEQQQAEDGDGVQYTFRCIICGRVNVLPVGYIGALPRVCQPGHDGKPTDCQKQQRAARNRRYTQKKRKEAQSK